MLQKITIDQCRKEEIKILTGGINDYNLSKVAPLNEIWTPIELVARDQDGEVLGGVLGGIGYWNGLEIRILWVKEEFRGKGIGNSLLKSCEEIAREKGATISMLDTFDFQAEGFYLKNGYKVIGEIHNFPAGHKRIYFSKELSGGGHQED